MEEFWCEQNEPSVQHLNDIEQWFPRRASLPQTGSQKSGRGVANSSLNFAEVSNFWNCTYQHFVIHQQN